MRYVPDSHNSRSFLSRLLAPGGWSAQFWAGILLAILLTGAGALVQTVDMARRSKASLITVRMHVARLVVTEATGGRNPKPRNVLVKPTEGSVFFRLVEPYDRVLEPVPSSDEELSFGYYPGDCLVHASADVEKEFRLVCLPHRVQVGSRVVLDEARVRRDKQASRRWMLAAFIAAVAVAGFSMFAKRRPGLSPG